MRRFAKIASSRAYVRPPVESHVSELHSIVETREIPGFVDEVRNVTYESHTFWITITAGPRGKYREVYVSVRHGGGWEIWRGDMMVAQVFAAIPDDRTAFLLAWSLLDASKDAASAASQTTGELYAKAFIDGRLKKRKHPAKGIVKVWIEEPNNPLPVREQSIRAWPPEANACPPIAAAPQFGASLPR